MPSDSEAPSTQLSDTAQARFNGCIRLASVLLFTIPTATMIAYCVYGVIEANRPGARQRREYEAHQERTRRENQAAREEVMNRLQSHGAREEPFWGKGRGLCLNLESWQGDDEDLADIPVLVELCSLVDALEIVAIGDAFSDTSLPYFADFMWLYGHYSLDLAGSRITDDGLAVLSESKVSELILDDTMIGDAGLVHVPKHVRFLSLKRTRVTDAGLVHLEHHNLWEIALDGCSITDEGLKWIRPHRQLSLADTDVRGPGLEVLRAGGHRQGKLDLSGTKITDETIECLAGVEFSLCVLDRTAITDEGLRRLLRHEQAPHRFRLAETGISPELAAAIQARLDKHENSIRALHLRHLLDSP